MYAERAPVCISRLPLWYRHAGHRPAKKNSFLIMSCVIFRAPAFRRFRAAGHLDTFAVDKSISNFSPGFVQVAPRGLAGDPEFFCCLFLSETFNIDEPNRFDLIGLQ